MEQGDTMNIINRKGIMKELLLCAREQGFFPDLRPLYNKDEAITLGLYLDLQEIMLNG